MYVASRGYRDGYGANVSVGNSNSRSELPFCARPRLKSDLRGVRMRVTFGWFSALFMNMSHEAFAREAEADGDPRPEEAKSVLCYDRATEAIIDAGGDHVDALTNAVVSG